MGKASGALRIIPLHGIPLVGVGDDVAALLATALSAHDEALGEGLILVVAQKIISKAEGRCVSLSTVAPSRQAEELAAATHKDPRFVQVVLDESNDVVRSGHDVLIVESRQGFICANAGVDRSNAGPDDDLLTLLPTDADASAATLRARLRDLSGAHLAVIVSDTHGRAFRTGAVGVAIGVAGLEAVLELRGRKDLFGYEFRVTSMAVADELAAAASLVMGQCAEGVPAVLIEGYAYQPSPAVGDAGVKPLLRPRDMDLFR